MREAGGVGRGLKDSGEFLLEPELRPGVRHFPETAVSSRCTFRLIQVNTLCSPSHADPRRESELAGVKGVGIWFFDNNSIGDSSPADFGGRNPWS